ncbi:hypothetical protein OQA88_11470 [Cercophora sp. LCS_1]
MDDRSSTSKPSASPSATDTKSPTTRPTYSSKLSDQKSRASEAAAAGPATRQPPVQQRAWTSNKNPITGRSQTPQNNFNSQNKQSVTNSLREGQRVRITLSSGAEFEGTWNNGPEPTSCRLSMVQQTKLPNSADISNGSLRREQASMSFQRKEIVDARVIPGNSAKGDGKALNGKRTSFRTDAAISNNRPGAERELKRWVPEPDFNTHLSLESGSSARGWDQFEENKRLFGLVSDYDENIYTTTIDRSAPNYRDRIAAADRTAREIMQTAPATSHVAEERIMDFAGGEDKGGDEEDKYSGVRRQQDFPPLTSRDNNKYTPPARRAPQGQSTVPGAPVDPAILSAQLKAAPTPKQQAPKAEEPKTTTAQKAPVPVVPESRPAETKAPAKAAESKQVDGKPENKVPEAKAGDKAPAQSRPSASTSRTTTPKDAAAGAVTNVERDVLSSFKNFANQQRFAAKEIRTTKMRQDKEIKLAELKNFAESFKLTTPVPKDLVSIIAKDPAKQKAIQEKAIQNAEEVAREKAAEAARKEKEATTAKESQSKTTAEQPPATTAPVSADNRNPSRPAAPQHANSPSGMPGRHTGPRAYNGGRPHYNNGYNGNNRATAHLANQGQGGAGLAQRIRDQKLQHPHMGQHAPVQDMRHPPTGPANNVDPSFARRGPSGNFPFTANKLNPNSHEFRPFAPAFMPAGPSQGSSPRSSVNNIVVEAVAPPPGVAGQLIRRKTKAVDVKKCAIITHIQKIQPPQGRAWDHNGGFKPSWDTPPTWRQLLEDGKQPETMHLTYKEYFDKLPLSMATATPNPSHVIPQAPAHQHQLPFHLQHGAQNMAPRQSPHLPPMQMHVGQHGPGAHVPFTNPDDHHRMMHSNSAQSFASPRMGQVPMYGPGMGTPGQLPYSQPMMQPYHPAAPPLGQFRSYSNTQGFIPQPHMSPMMVQPQFMPGPNGMAGPQASMYPANHQPYAPPNMVPQQPMAGSNGFPSPSRPVAPMMVQQGSHQGQPNTYGMSPGMPYQQPFQPQQPQGKFSAQQRPQ